MLVARRDPPFHVDADDASRHHEHGYPPARASSRLTRFVTAIQLIGSLLAVPIGIASAYSFYRANFSPETTCQNLRGSIVAMLDKSVDATTRRGLVRRDVEEFERTCAAVDPDATAAFKSLLADKSAIPVATIPPSTEPNLSRDTRPKEPARKAEPRPQTAAKQPAAAPAAAATESARRDPAVSDAQWLDAVRQALVTHKTELRPIEATKPKAPVPAAQPAAQEAVLPTPVTAPAATVAPALPPPVAVAPPSRPRVDTDHPVPPGSIPETPATETAKPDEQGRSRIGKWISTIPLLGPVVDNARH